MHRRIAGLALAWLGLLTVGAQAEIRVALVIGNANYSHAAALANPGRDADAVANALRQVGFSVDERTNTGSQALRDAILVFAQRARDADVAVVYYSGHGVQADGINYLIPVDAKLESAASLGLEAVPADTVLAAVEHAHRLRLLILDACRENPFKAQFAAMGTKDIRRGLAPIEGRGLGDTMIAFAARDGTVAFDGKGADSPYAAALVHRILERGTEIDKLFREVRDDVLRATDGKQEPFVYGSRSSQDFFFLPPVPTAPVPAPILPAQSASADLAKQANVCVNGTGTFRLDACTVAIDSGNWTGANLAWAYNDRGNALDDLKKYDQAILDYSKAVELKPDLSEGFYNRAGAHEDLGQEVQAIQDYDRALALKPNDPDSYYSRGVAHDKLKQFALGIADYDKVIAMRPDYADALANRGADYLELNQSRRAISDIDRALAIRPDAEDFRNRAIAKTALGDKAGADADMTKARALDSTIEPI